VCRIASAAQDSFCAGADRRYIIKPVHHGVQTIQGDHSEAYALSKSVRVAGANITERRQRCLPLGSAESVRDRALSCLRRQGALNI